MAGGATNRACPECLVSWQYAEEGNACWNCGERGLVIGNEAQWSAMAKRNIWPECDSTYRARKAAQTAARIEVAVAGPLDFRG